ncbi:MAG: C25 family cysteine peptidase [Candidatus Eisenbacteria bacterium]
MRRLTATAWMLVLAVVIAWTASALGAGRAAVADFSIGEGRATATLRSGAYQVSQETGGSRIEMEGFGHLMVPGSPRLPMERFLIALPPGARALSVDVVTAETVQLPDVYEIEPFPQIMMLPGMPRHDEAMERMGREWETKHESVYFSDSPFPSDVAWLAERGTLRKYAYASVAFCPFTYYPESGRLDYHSEVSVVITYDLPVAGSAEAQDINRRLHDRVADEKAAGLFSNYDEIAGLYESDGLQPLPQSETYDYVIITTSGLESAITASDFPTWKASLGYGLRTVLVTDTEITTQPGVDLAEQIRNFLMAYYLTWGIEYVLFVGDYATVPMRICYPDPTYHVYDPSDPGLIAPGTPNDYYFADLSFPDAVSWDSDGDGYHGEYGDDDPDFLAEVAVGRIPVNSPARITYTLDKLVTFEQDTGAWKNNALSAGSILFFENQNHSGYPFIDGTTCLDSIETGLMGGMTLTHMSEQAGVMTSPYPWPPISESAFNTAWRTGEHAYVNWSGHGWSDGAYRTVWEWDDGDGVPEQSNGEMVSYQFIHAATSNLDDDHPSIVFAISCNVGYPDPNPYGNCGIDLLTLPGWGSSAGIVSSSRPAAVSSDWKTSPGGTEQICFDFNRYMIAEGDKVGDALYNGKFDAHTNYGWDGVYEYMNLYNFNLYGDPALVVAGANAGVASSGGEEAGDAGLRVRLGPGRPNPFTATATLRLTLSAGTRVRITVHDVMGREVASLANSEYPAGEFAVTWDGTGHAGEILGPGIYFVAVEAGSRKVTRKTVHVR